MKKYRKFKCGSCNKDYEKLIEDDIKTITCLCGSKAIRLISTPRYFSNTTGKSPCV